MVDGEKKYILDPDIVIYRKILYGFLFVFLLTIITMIFVSWPLFNSNLTESENRLSSTVINVLENAIEKVSFAGKYHTEAFTESLLKADNEILYIAVVGKNNALISLSVDQSVSALIDQKSILDKTKKNSYSEVSSQLNIIEIPHIEKISSYKIGYDETKEGRIILGIRSLEKEKLQLTLFQLISIGAIISLFGGIVVSVFSRKLTAPIHNIAIIFKNILKETPIFILLKNKDNHILDYSNSFRDELVGCSTDFRGRKMTNLPLAKNDLDNLMNLQEFVKEGEFKIVNERGDLNHYEVINFNIAQSGGEELNCSMGLNINKQRQMEQKLRQKTLEAKASSDAKTVFLATMSHEIRTPLTSIIGNLSILEEKMGQEEHLRFAIGSSEHLLSVINQILDISKIEAGEMSFEKIAFSPIEVIKQLEKTFNYLCKEKGLDFIFDINQSVADQYVGDELRFKQILTNIIGNAIKFTSDGHIKVSVSGKEIEGKSNLLLVSVEDTGIGMSEQQVKTAFVNFSQADSSISRRFG